MADTPSSGTTVTGLLKSLGDLFSNPQQLLTLANESPQLLGAAVNLMKNPPKWLEAAEGGLFGAAEGASGRMDIVPAYWGGVYERRNQRALGALGRQWGLPEGTVNNLPPGTRLQDLAAMLPEYQITPGGQVAEFPFAQPPRQAVDPTGQPLQFAPKPTRIASSGIPERAKEMFFAANGRLPTTEAEIAPFYERARQDLSVQKQADIRAGVETRTEAKGPDSVVDKPTVVWVYPTGKPVVDIDGPISTKEARAHGARPISQATSERIVAGQVSLTMLKNLADVIDRMNASGKLVKTQGLNALWDRANLKWKDVSADPDLAELQGYASDLIIIARNLGEKGVRAQQAFNGMLSLLETGKAPYQAIKNYLRTNLDQALRASAPQQVPGAFDDFPGARRMGEPTQGTIDPDKAKLFTP